jgi:hypothetical protein
MNHGQRGLVRERERERDRREVENPPQDEGILGNKYMDGHIAV